MRAALLLSIASLLATAACGPRPANDLTREEAWQASQTTYQSANMSSASIGAMATYSVTQSIDAPCPGGGSVAMDMAAAIDMDGTGGEAMDMNVNISAGYNACTYYDVTLDGAAAISMSMTNSSAATSVSMTMAGDLWFTGAIEGSCSFNYSASVSTNGMTGVTQIDLSGNYCGYDIDDLEAEFQASAG